jgi:hypothetical protein
LVVVGWVVVVLVVVVVVVVLAGVGVVEGATVGLTTVG